MKISINIQTTFLKDYNKIHKNQTSNKKFEKLNYIRLRNNRHSQKNLHMSLKNTYIEPKVH